LPFPKFSPAFELLIAFALHEPILKGRSERQDMAETQIIIVDDHPLFRDALKAALSASTSQLSISEAGSLEQALELLGTSADCDLILLDLKMPGVHGLSGLAFLRAEYPGIPVAIVSGQEDAAVIRRALALGASGFIPKSTSAETMRQAVAAILAGHIWSPPVVAGDMVLEQELDNLSRRLATLTPQQVRVLMMLRSGLLNKQIAYELSVSEATVKAHVSAILLKLNVDSRTQAVIAASKLDGESVDSGT
jgi:DNA-binding NarL/FixJ family response regulator